MGGVAADVGERRVLRRERGCGVLGRGVGCVAFGLGLRHGHALQREPECDGFGYGLRRGTWAWNSALARLRRGLICDGLGHRLRRGLVCGGIRLRLLRGSVEGSSVISLDMAPSWACMWRARTSALVWLRQGLVCGGLGHFDMVGVDIGSGIGLNWAQVW